MTVGDEVGLGVALAPVEGEVGFGGGGGVEGVRGSGEVRDSLRGCCYRDSTGGQHDERNSRRIIERSVYCSIAVVFFKDENTEETETGRDQGNERVKTYWCIPA